MTRRIAITILMTVWAMLIVGGLLAYAAVRSVLLDDLDRALVHDARQVPEVERIGGEESLQDARYFILGEDGQRVGSSTTRVMELMPAEVLGRQFVRLPDGQRYRSLTIRFAAPDGRSLTMIYGEPSTRFDQAMRHLALSLAMVGLVAGAAAGGVAAYASRAALRPLRDTASVIGAIDEARLDRRIDVAALPPELRPTAERLNEMLQRLSDAFAQRKQFLADASHELRTPVAALVTTLEVALRRPRDAAALTRTLETCLTDAQLLRRMVQSLLEHARGESRPAEMVELDCAALLDEAADLIQPLAASKDVQIIRSYAAGTATVLADPRRLSSVLTNLLANAVEYNGPGGTVELSIDGADQGSVELVVQDTGIGIAEEHLPSLFEPFFRAGQSAHVTEPEGTHLGLGLFLVRSHLKAMGGTCHVQSQIGVGTRFRLRLAGGATTRAQAGPAPRQAAVEVVAK